MIPCNPHINCHDIASDRMEAPATVSALSVAQASKVSAVPLAQANTVLQQPPLPVITHSLIQARPKRYTHLPANLQNARVRTYVYVCTCM